LPRHYNIEKVKKKSRQNEIECVVVSDDERDTKEANQQALWRVVEWRLWRGGIRRGAHNYITHHHILRVCYIHYLTLFWK